ncbi:MAG TPA: amino acid permease [Longimicrobiales bacterium]|nr:amino acid permease [Longimicrobiales bacterium]
MAEFHPPALVRAVTRRQLVGLSINDVIGSGVYLLPAAAAALLGMSSILGVLLAGFAVALLVLCFAEASSYFDQPGGAYLYTREAFGPFVGFEVGWMTWLARVASVASLSNGFALAVAFVWAPAASGSPRVAIIAALIGVLTWINIVGVRQGAGTAVALVIAKIVPLVIFISVGIFFVDWSRIAEVNLPPVGSLGEASLLLLFAYAGFENTPAAAGEYRNPQRDVPFAMLTMILVVTLVYTGVQLVALGTLPGVAGSASPVAEAASTFLGPGGALMMTVAAMVSIGGNVGNTVLVGPRYLYALARDGYGPRFLAHVHPRFNTPAAAIVTLSAVAFVLALSGTFVQLAMLSIIARLTTYIGTAAAVPILRRRMGERPNAIRLPGGATIPLLALLLSVVFLSSARLHNLIAGVIALALGAGIYMLRRGPEPVARPPTDAPASLPGP